MRVKGLLTGERLPRFAVVENYVDNADSGYSINQAMVHARNKCAAASAQAVHQGQVPERLAPVHELAEDLAGEGLQFGLRAALQVDMTKVVTDSEIGIVFPGRVTEMQGRKHNALAVTWNQRELRFDVAGVGLKRDGSVEDGNAADVHRRCFGLEVEEGGVFGRQPVAVLIGHEGNLLGKTLHAWRQVAENGKPQTVCGLPRCYLPSGTIG